MNIAPVVQGSAEWLQLRAKHCNASEAPAAAGVSRYMTREALMRQKSTGVGADVDERTQTLFARGHSAEDGARPIAEEIVSGDLYPVIATLEVDGVALLASLDGVTLEGDIIFEHKLYSEALANDVRNRSLSPNYTLQMDQQLLVTGAKKCLFMTSDGTRERMAWCWYESTPEKAAAVVATWKQFLADLAAYVPPERTPIVTATPMETLPAVSVRMDGTLAVQSNLPAFGAALKVFVSKIPAKPSTDQEFADTEAACRALKKAEEALEAAEAGALASMSDVEAMRRMVADFRELARTTRLASEKLVTARKAAIREEEVARGRAAFSAHFKALCDRLGGPFLPVMTPDFAGAIKGLKTLDSVRNAIDTALAQAKIETSAQADKIEANLKTINAATPTVQLARLFHDRATLALKDADAVAAIVAQRVSEFQAEETRRLEVERERIRAEEASRQREQERTESALPGTPGPYAGNVAQAAQATPSGARDGAHAEQCAPVSFSPPDTPPTLKLGTMSERLGFTVSRAFIETTLGFKPAAIDKSNGLWRESAWPPICAKLADHVLRAGGAA